jgi:ribose transport system ATP-binding protein
VDGRPVSLPLETGAPRALGLRFVHQDLGLIPSLSVLENLCLEELGAARGARIAWRRERRKASEAFARFEVDLEPRATVAELRPVDRALLAIVRAVDGMPQRGVLVLDEPTAFLPTQQRERLFALLRRISERGSSVMIVSHDLAEVRRLADRITVLRDGRNAATVIAGEVDPRELVELVVGRQLPPPPARAAVNPRRGVSVSGLSGEAVRDVSLEVGCGEVLGVAGLPGSGFDEVPYLLFGARRAHAGRLDLGGQLVLPALTPDRALASGIALLPADRSRDGSVGSLAVGENVLLPVLDRYMAGARLDRRRMGSDAAQLLGAQDVRPADPKLSFEALSGGNQQKALLAKWLHTRPKLLLLDEPTRGVDIGAREGITAALRALARQGMCVLCASSDHEQLAQLCDRVIVLSGGRVADELGGAEVSEERIAERCHALSG